MIDDQKTNRSPSNTNRTCRTFGSARETADQDAPRLLYSRHGAARQLSISVRSLDYLIANKELATRRIGKKVLVPHGELVRYAKGNHPSAIKHAAA